MAPFNPFKKNHPHLLYLFSYCLCPMQYEHFFMPLTSSLRHSDPACVYSIHKYKQYILLQVSLKEFNITLYEKYTDDRHPILN